MNESTNPILNEILKRFRIECEELINEMQFFQDKFSENMTTYDSRFDETFLSKKLNQVKKMTYEFIQIKSTLIGENNIKYFDEQLTTINENLTQQYNHYRSSQK